MAEALTTTTSHSESPGRAREFLVFVMANELYAVELIKVREILSVPPVTPVPRAGPSVLGVCSVRGLLVTVVDLRRALKLPEAEPGPRARILLAEGQEGEVLGLLVDEVRQVVRLAESEIELASQLLGSDISDHVMGIGRPQGSVLILIDLSSAVPR